MVICSYDSIFRFRRQGDFLFKAPQLLSNAWGAFENGKELRLKIPNWSIWSIPGYADAQVKADKPVNQPAVPTTQVQYIDNLGYENV